MVSPRSLEARHTGIDGEPRESRAMIEREIYTAGNDLFQSLATVLSVLRTYRSSLRITQHLPPFSFSVRIRFLPQDIN